jgi:hypothetical protein
VHEFSHVMAGRIPAAAATGPGGGGAGYRVFTANGSLNQIRLPPKSVLTRPASRMRGPALPNGGGVSSQSSSLRLNVNTTPPTVE